MKIGVALQPLQPGAVEFAREAERLGVGAAWTPEVWGYDALTGLAHVASQTETIELGTFVVQLGSRSPALLAGSALSLQEISGGRFKLGIGVSGPQVMEGWHGVRFDRPAQRTRETIEIVRMVSRGERLDHPGSVYPLPLPDSRGKALKPMLSPREVPIYVAALGPMNLRLTGELADGWLGNAFIPEQADIFLDPIREGAAKVGRSLAELDLVAPVAVQVTADDSETEEHVRRHASGYAFTIGAMGSGKENFYNTAFSRLGYGDEVAEVSRLWRAGEREQAEAMVPLDLGAKTNLIGTPEQITERIRAYDDAGITSLLAKLEGDFDDQLRTLEILTRATSAL